MNIIGVCSPSSKYSGLRSPAVDKAFDAFIRIGSFYSSTIGDEPVELMINIMPIFINFLAVDSLRLDNDRIEKFCLERKKNNSGRVISNGGAWQSDNLDLATPELAELFAEGRKRLDEVHRAFEFSVSMRQ